ncbi:MAG: hypothetical protein ACRDIX_09485 [Actinomycetota bacterium]
MLALVALAAAACARITGGGGSDSRIEYPRGSEDLVLQVHSGGGFVPVHWHLREHPHFSLYGDGRVITQGPQIAIFPPPALPALLERRVSDEGIQAILRAAREAGLHGRDRRFEVFEVTDLPTTTFTVVTDGQAHETAVYGLGEVPDDLPVADREERRTLFEFQSKLLDLESWLPEGSVSLDRPYEYDRLRVFVVPAGEGGGDYGGDEELQPSRMDWPLPEALSAFGEPMPNTPDIRCGAVEGPDLNEVLTAAGKANVETLWRSGGTVHLIAFVPLLPGEPPCPEQ